MLNLRATALSGSQRAFEMFLKFNGGRLLHRGTSDRSAFLECHLQHTIGLYTQKVLQALDPTAQRLNRHQTIISTLEMGAATRPWPVVGSRHRFRLDGVHGNVPESSHEVGRIHRNTAKSTLKQVPGYPKLPIDVPTVTPVCLTHGTRQSRIIRRHQNQMNMIGYQAVGPHLYTIDATRPR
jgi:hypothetical protein